MLRRPPGHVALWATLAVIVLPCLQYVDAQQQHGAQANPVATPLTAQQHHTIESPRIHERRKTTISQDVDNSNNNIYIPDDARAQALAPDLSVRAPPPSSYSLGRGAGLSQHIARSLEDWEVEDFVLLATVDGDLYASDRKTGEERWRFKATQPMVETRHFRTNNSVLDDDYDPIDHYIWVVEPTRDGELYLWRPSDNGDGLTKLAWTMKKIVEELSPLEDDGVLYIGDKKTTMVTLNAATGTILKEFSSSGSYINKVESESCSKPNALADGDDECSNSRSITLGRTEYMVTIQRIDGSPIASLRYSEWGPNTRDNDLIQQNIMTKDKCYIASHPNGNVYGFDYARRIEGGPPLFTQKLDSPVARVFDVLHRWGTRDSVDPGLIVLPQPPIPATDDATLRDRSQKVLVNQTEAGSFYALSGSRYPLILSSPEAPAQRIERWKLKDAWELGNGAQISKVLVGVHSLPGPSPGRPVGKGGYRIEYDSGFFPPLIDAPPEHETIDPPNPDAPLLPPPPPEPSRIIETAKRLPEMAANTLFDLFTNPAAIMIFIFSLWALYKDKLSGFKATQKSLNGGQGIVKLPGNDAPILQASPKEQPSPVLEPSEEKEEQAKIVNPVTPPPEPSLPVPETPKAEPSPPVPVVPPSPPISEPSPQPIPAPAPALQAVEAVEAGVAEGTPKKKKGHRGRRGGVKHKKGPQKEKRENSQSRDDDPPQESVDEVVNKAKELGPRPGVLEPDILTVPGNTDEISGHIIRMGNLEVNEAEQLGTGSNGTVVFPGTWEGRAVAVKRMLVQFNEIATQETRLLRESDDHPNVIRYFTQQKRASFLYIALELCQASLADVIQKPASFRQLAQAGEREMPNVLFQIANGLSHLHSLKIVHRDLKPQNILVNLHRGELRVLISDFGLCKKLEGGQSSFGATTAHAAGTTGWRAPELLVDDDQQAASQGPIPEPHSSLHSTSGITGPEGAVPGSRRVTRAIDIFSLGLVFYYVLTRGYHPFDEGGKFMREVNIRNENYTLEHLDALGDAAPEAKDLVESMIQKDPKVRPKAAAVMAHPFFWSDKKRLNFLCDVSDHFEKEPRDPPSAELVALERAAREVISNGDFLKALPQPFVDSLGKQRKYTGGKMLDLLRALRNKRNHYEDLTEPLKKMVGSLPAGYLHFWTSRFPNLLLSCWNVVYDCHWDETDRFREYYEPQKML
ncbi:hypothetical protein QBC38DRAFT_119944 [Podospora fimiseda]|uniref:non-specific serine/threonine protein kinase n=1 Tax=Podospora fimiseda TaxID=252190 RepID=A0AAN7BTI2_9PEZI|nr:hypothetical protein QBC38DRAFT_119944 [Podospora fimiseda]